MKISIQKALRLLSLDNHPSVNLILISGERRLLCASEAVARLQIDPQIACQSRAGVLYKIAEKKAHLPVLESAIVESAIYPHYHSLPTWKRCFATTGRACVPVSQEWIEDCRPHAARTVKA